MEYFTYLCCHNYNSTIMVKQNPFTDSLFDEFKPPFTPEDFRRDILTSDFERGIIIAHRKAYQDANMLQDRCTFRTTANVTHDCTHYYLQKELAPLGFEFYMDSAGNTRAYFTKGDYAFILKKKDASTNSTGVSKTIREQMASRHVITISYETDQFHTEVERVYVQYIQGECVIFSYTITPDAAWGLDIVSPSTHKTVEHKKPKLKMTKSEAI